jgi:ubiquinone/menaquinone biosynthesis C-methylase UbiE
MAIDNDRLMEFLGRFVGDLGATMAAGNVVVGHRLGLYRALGEGPATAAELAERTGTHPRYVAEWLRGQAAGGYVERTVTGEDEETYSLTEEQALCLTSPDNPVYAPGAFVFALGTLKAEPRITEAVRTGTGVGWHEHDEDVFVGCEQFFRPGYLGNLDTWIGALEGVEQKLRAGIAVADVGCGLGASSVLMAQRWPASQVHGSDYHGGSIELARKRAAEAGVADRLTFEAAGAQDFGGTGYDLVTTFDCLHDMGDPLAAARHIRQSLAPDGTWMIVEPFAQDDPSGNQNPVGRVYYNFSTFLCLPNAISQSGGYTLGAQAGEAAIRRVVTDAGFTRFGRVAETPFNLVYEARP